MKRAHERTLRTGWGSIACALLLAVSPAALAGPYTFVNIADTTGPLANFLGGNVSLNAGGTVAFAAPFDAGGQGVFTGNGGPVTTVADTSGPFSGFGGTAINTGGTVAFQATLGAGAGSGIFSIGGGQATIAQTGGAFSALGQHVAINNGGTVAFLGELSAGGGSGAFAGNGGAPITLAGTSGPLNDFVLNLNPRIGFNNSGTAAFVARLDGGGAGVFTGSGGALTTVFTTPGTAITGLGLSTAINDSGTVVFVGVDNKGTPNDTTDDSAAIYKWTAGSLATVADSSGQFSGFGGLAINAAGTVLFLGVLDSGGFGYYTSDDLVNPVISSGDSLFGAAVTGLDSLPAFNDAGQIAFTYELRGLRGVARADPLAAGVPAPATLALLAAGLAGLGCARRKRV